MARAAAAPEALVVARRVLPAGEQMARAAAAPEALVVARPSLLGRGPAAQRLASAASRPPWPERPPEGVMPKGRGG